MWKNTVALIKDIFSYFNSSSQYHPLTAPWVLPPNRQFSNDKVLKQQNGYYQINLPLAKEKFFVKFRCFFRFTFETMGAKFGVTIPGWIAPTQIPCRFKSIRMAWFSESTACFVAQYMFLFGYTSFAAVKPILIICPFSRATFCFYYHYRNVQKFIQIDVNHHNPIF